VSANITTSEAIVSLSDPSGVSPKHCAVWLAERNNFLIISHRRPDGDTLGSAAALAQGLRETGKTAFVLFNPEVTPRYAPFVGDYWAPDDYKPENIIAVDTASVDLFTDNAGVYKNSVSLGIDHHTSNSLYAGVNCIDAGRAACGEIIFDILMALSGAVSSETAERLYIALSTDTGCFSFGNTTANTLSVAARLIEYGAPNRVLNKMLFRTKTRGRIKIEGMLASGLEFHYDGKVAITAITREMMEAAGACEDDMDDIAVIAGSVKGVGIGITIREMSSANDCKVSVRTMLPYNAHAICLHFGGGGHKMAAGCTIEKPIDEVKTGLLEVLPDYLNLNS